LRTVFFDMRYKPRTRERILLLAATLVAGAALALTYGARARTFDETGQDLTDGRIINLSAVPSAEALGDAVRIFPTKPENQFVAAKIYQAVAGPEAHLRLKSVGALSQIKVHAADLGKNPSLESFKRRLAEKESAPLLTPQQLSQLRPALVV